MTVDSTDSVKSLRERLGWWLMGYGRTPNARVYRLGVWLWKRADDDRR